MLTFCNYLDNNNSIPLENVEKEITKYQSFWKAVLIQALMDASTTSKKTKRKKERLSALKWLLEDPAFINVCQLANVDESYIRSYLEKKLSGIDTKTQVIKLINTLLLNVKL